MNKDIDIANGRLEEALGNVRYCYRTRIDELKAENAKLKELLKECSYRIDWRTRTGHKPSDEEKQKLFDKIGQVLG